MNLLNNGRHLKWRAKCMKPRISEKISKTNVKMEKINGQKFTRKRPSDRKKRFRVKRATVSLFNWLCVCEYECVFRPKLDANVMFLIVLVYGCFCHSQTLTDIFRETLKQTLLSFLWNPMEGITLVHIELQTHRTLFSPSKFFSNHGWYSHF